MEDLIIGGWSPWNFDVDAQAKDAFEKALDGFIGTDFEPLFAYSFRPTSKSNFCFLTGGTRMTNPSITNLYKVYTTSLSGNNTLENIVAVQPEANGMPGSWASWSFVPDNSVELNAAMKALQSLIGVEYAFKGFTRRGSTGTMEVAIFAEGTVVSPAQHKMAVIAYIDVVDGQGKIRKIDEVRPENTPERVVAG